MLSLHRFRLIIIILATSGGGGDKPNNKEDNKEDEEPTNDIKDKIGEFECIYYFELTSV